MRHYSSEEWLAYVEGKLSAENQREYEDHLYNCDVCLQLYTACMVSLELGSVTSSSISSDLNEAFTEQIMTRIKSEKQLLPKLSTPLRKTALYRKPVFQYALAAAITLILMTTGVFHGITGGIGQQSLTTKQTVYASYTDQLMDKTVAMLDSIQLKAKLIEKGGEKHE
jgi:anti-sigma factor RsiW